MHFNLSLSSMPTFYTKDLTSFIHIQSSNVQQNPCQVLTHQTISVAKSTTKNTVYHVFSCPFWIEPTVYFSNKTMNNKRWMWHLSKGDVNNCWVPSTFLGFLVRWTRTFALIAISSTNWESKSEWWEEFVRSILTYVCCGVKCYKMIKEFMTCWKQCMTSPGIGLLVVHQMYEEENSHIRPFIVIGNLPFG